MIGFWVRIIIIFLAACLQAAILGMTDSTLFSINIVLLLVLAWTLVLGFSRAIGWILLAGFVADLLFFFPVGFSPFLFIFVGYVMSSLTRQFLVSHAFWGKLATIGLVCMATAVEGVFQLVIIGVWQGSSILLDLEWFSLLREFIFIACLHVLIFPLLFVLISRVEKLLSFYERRVQPKKYA